MCSDILEHSKLLNDCTLILEICCKVQIQMQVWHKYIYAIMLLLFMYIINCLSKLDLVRDRARINII